MSTFVPIHGAGSEAWYRHLLVPDASASRQTDGRGHLPALARPKDLAERLDRYVRELDRSAG